MEWAEHICTLGQESVRGHKRLLYYGRWAPPSEAFPLANDIFYWMGGKPGVVVDQAVGARAFAEKRPVDFSEMFNPPRFHCPNCHSEYVVAKYQEEGTLVCCGEVVESGPLPS